MLKALAYAIIKKFKMIIKPIPPTEYDGTADARAYHHFVTEGTEYLTSGKVGKRQQAFDLSYYLTGKAYDFYTQKVSINYKKYVLFFSAPDEDCIGHFIGLRMLKSVNKKNGQRCCMIENSQYLPLDCIRRYEHGER